ncbi:MAG TPA: undecaprenyl/decaprenyl-phosphate alpha-N-acetylglucosaminyl 1-phosphate transferase [Anaerolineae bacterium]|nr:undecaprenyl/decaprenyl-phosphate alpha-N-acetylglucosaminyl 1-phosphate transferase [Anaerolineae bacterium]
MGIVLVIFTVALFVTAVSIPWVRRLAVHLGFVDAPARRKLHVAPMPLLGGLAIFGGAVIALIAFSGRLPSSVSGVLAAMTIVVLTGLLDDWRGLPAWAKMGGLLLASVILILFDIRVKLPIPEALNIALTLLWLLGIANAINFLDNMDGLSAGISAVAASFMLLLGLVNDQFLVSALAAAVLGATLGFLRYNFKPARIFMGDAGSLFLGFLLALLGLQLRFPDNVSFVTWMVPVFILAVPVFDMTLVVVSRLRRGLSPNTPGKDHSSHRLVQVGCTQREAVLIIYLITGATGMVAIFITQATIPEGYIIFGIALALAAAAIWRLEKKWDEDVIRDS